MKQPKKIYDVKFARRMTNRIEYCIRQFADRFDATDPTDDQIWFVQRMISFAIEYGRRQEAIDHYAFQSIRDFGERKMKVKIDDGGYIPQRGHWLYDGAGFRSCESVTLEPHDGHVFELNVDVQLPRNCFGRMVSNSGLMMNHGQLS